MRVKYAARNLHLTPPKLRIIFAVKRAFKENSFPNRVFRVAYLHIHTSSFSELATVNIFYFYQQLIVEGEIFSRIFFFLSIFLSILTFLRPFFPFPPGSSLCVILSALTKLASFSYLCLFHYPVESHSLLILRL